MFKKSAILSSIAILMLAVSIPALAIPPDMNKLYFEDDLIVAWECDGFNIMELGDTLLMFTTFYDKNGEMVKETVHFTVQRAVFYNSENPDISYRSNVDMGFAETSFENGLPVEYRERGVFWHIMLPGGEKIQFIAGLGVYDYATDTYDHYGLEFWQGDGLCEYFAE